MSNKYALEHRKNSGKTTIYTLIIIFSWVFGIPLFFAIGPFAMIVIFLGTVVGMLGLVFTGSAQSKNIKGFKEEYVIPRMMDFFTDFEYKLDSSLQTSTIRTLKLFDIGDSIYTDELIQGRYRDCSFLMGNVRCTETRRDSDGDTHTTTVFSGRLIIIGTSIIDEGEVTIRPRRMFSYPFRRGQILEYDHPICNRFEIRGTNYTELPKYLLDHINSFADIFSKYKFYYKIVNDRIYIAIDRIDNLYNVRDFSNTSLEAIDEIIKKDSIFFTNLISLILDAKEKGR